jgi:putative colanic acid biosynthesis acetyltransferase WcaF
MGMNNLTRLDSPSRADKLRRLAWLCVQSTVFRWSPVPMHAFRCSILRCFGARIEAPSNVYPTAVIWAPWNLEMKAGSCLGPRVVCYSVGPITLNAYALVSQGAHLCAATHDYRDPTFPLLVGAIEIGEKAWIAADAFIGPGVHVGALAIVGARAVVVRDVGPADVVVGNPIRVVGKRPRRNLMEEA